MKIKSPPAPRIYSLQQKQSPGGGVLIGYDLNAKDPSAQYVAAQAFSGDYEITVSRVYGQPLGNRARLVITQNAGTPEQSRRIEVVNVEQNATIKLNVKDGRRTELAPVAPAAQKRRTQPVQERDAGAFNDLRAVANPSFHGTTGSRSNGPSVASMAARDQATPITQNASVSVGGVQLTTQLRQGADARSWDMVIRPFFATSTGNRPTLNLAVIPGGMEK